MTTLAALHREVRRRLAESGIDDSASDARLLVEHATGTTRLDALRAPEQEVGNEGVERVEAMIARRLAGEPVHRIMGQREFYGLMLELSEGTLEPRPDTEALVEITLAGLRPIADATGTVRLLELGTGTGAVALALLHAEPRASALATDISEDALTTARRNAAALGLAARLETLAGSWFAPVRGRYDAIVSNPPYIRTQDIAGLSREVREYDPPVALDGGADGLDAYRAIADEAARHLTEAGFVAVEIGHDQREDVETIFKARAFRLDGELRDLGGHVRALRFRPGKA